MARGQGGGRPAKPTNLKLLHGDRKDRVNQAEPQPAEDAIEPPGWLAGDALANWHRLAPDRIAKRVLTVWDIDAFAQFCSALVVARDVFAGSDTAEIKRAVDTCATLGGRFGWTPSDRAKLTVGDRSRRDDDADLLTG